MYTPLHCRDIEKIHAAIGDNVAIVIQWLTTFFASYVVGFIRDWRLALVLLGVTPILAVVAAIFAKVRGKGTLGRRRGGERF